MGMTIDECITILTYPSYYLPTAREDALSFAINTLHKYQKLQADYEARLKENNKLVNDLEELRTMINKFAESYENRLKADMVAMLTELKNEMNSIKECEQQIYGKESWDFVGKCQDVVQQKIDKLKETD